jgi:diaminopimelate epimerase
MEMYNADGSQSEMCGNGIRCVGKYVYDYGLTDKKSISVETLAGIKYLDFVIEAGKVALITVNMGSPELVPEKVPVDAAAIKGIDASEINGLDKVVDRTLEVDGKDYNVTCVSMGNPHCVTFVEDTTAFPLEEEGPKFESHAAFPNRVNAEFIQIISRNEVNMRVWERGAAVTLACGTGSCATVVAGVLNDKIDRKAEVQLDGGKLIVEWAVNNHVFMTGPAELVFTGEWNG